VHVSTGVIPQLTVDWFVGSSFGLGYEKPSGQNGLGRHMISGPGWTTSGKNVSLLRRCPLNSVLTVRLGNEKELWLVLFGVWTIVSA
jgi:hypothetical protein